MEQEKGRVVTGRRPSLKAPSEEKFPGMARTALPKRLKDKKNLTDLQDMVEDCSKRISFIESFFSQGEKDCEPEMSDDDAVGLCLILRDIQDDLDMVVDELWEKRGKGLIVEREVD